MKKILIEALKFQKLPFSDLYFKENILLNLVMANKRNRMFKIEKPQISDNYIKHPSDVLKVGDLVKVKVLGVDTVKKKISLTMKTAELPHGIAVENQKTDRERKQGRRDAERKRDGAKKQLSNDELKELLMKKFGR